MLEHIRREVELEMTAAKFARSSMRRGSSAYSGGKLQRAAPRRFVKMQPRASSCPRRVPSAAISKRPEMLWLCTAPRLAFTASVLSEMDLEETVAYCHSRRERRLPSFVAFATSTQNTN
eukprot:s14_g11.t1